MVERGLFADLVRASRKRKRLTLSDVADALGVSIAYVSAVELGHKGPPSFDTARRWAVALGVDAAPLIAAAAPDPHAACKAERAALRAAIGALLPELVDVREYPNEGRVTFCRSCTGTLTIERQQHRREHPPSGHTKYCRWEKALGMIDAALDGAAPRDAAGD